ncbi:Integrase protein [Methylorubrum thiocyanatum]
MKDVIFKLRTLVRHNTDGSEGTQAGREDGLQLYSRELWELGYAVRDPRNLKPKHVTALVAHWKKTRISHATIRNRLGHLRWLATKIGKPGLLPATNEIYGLEQRQRFKGIKAVPLDADKLARIEEPRIRLALRLQRAFGLRREEALKFRPAVADRGGYLALQPSWTKGGRYREIPLTDPRQRALLDEVHAACGRGSLIPEGMAFHLFRKAYDNATLRVGLRNNHGLRHWYACWRYHRLTGEAPPAMGGRTCEDMTPAERRREFSVRLQVSRELGHNRVDVTATYLGPRWTQKVAA